MSTTSGRHLFAAACLIGAIVSVVLALACVVAYAHHSRRADELDFLGQAIALLGAIGGLVGADRHPGRVNRLYKYAAWLGTIGFIALLGMYGAKHGWSS